MTPELHPRSAQPSKLGNPSQFSWFSIEPPKVLLTDTSVGALQRCQLYPLRLPVLPDAEVLAVALVEFHHLIPRGGLQRRRQPPLVLQPLAFQFG